MKKVALWFVPVMALASSGAFAQSAQSAGNSANQQLASLTQEQVQSELVASRNDGSLARINLLYAHH
jgi:hypothetical protein